MVESLLLWWGNHEARKLEKAIERAMMVNRLAKEADEAIKEILTKLEALRIDSNDVQMEEFNKAVEAYERIMAEIEKNKDSSNN